MNAIETPTDIMWLAIVAALIGALVAFIGAIIHNDRQLRANVDENLRDTRTKLYKPLWTQTQIVPKWPRNKGITHGQFTQLAQTLNAWYFSEGGIYLSMPARKAYGRLQDTLQHIAEKAEAEAKKHKADAENHQSETEKPIPANPDSKPVSGRDVSDRDYDTVLKRCSRLRRELSTDLASRSKLFHSD